MKALSAVIVSTPPERTEGAEYPLRGIHRLAGQAGGEDHVV
jgi:hypothetical protein